MNDLIDKGPEEAKRKQDRQNMYGLRLIFGVIAVAAISFGGYISKCGEANNWKRQKLQQDTIIINQAATINMLSYGKH